MRIIASCEALSIHPSKITLEAVLNQQKLFYFIEGKLKRVWEISSSIRPPSEIENSFGTPRGLHRVVEKIGEDQPIGMVFKGRRPIGQCYSDLSEEEQAKSLITTRILRLRGCEPGRNAGPGRDTFDRYVYIHGTNLEDKIGQPASAGCIHLRNTEVIDLFKLVPVDTLLFISED